VREYEVTIVINPTIDDEARNEIIERVKGWLTAGNGEGSEPVVNHWGQRALAYTIKGHRDGYYVFYEASMEPARMNEVEREILYVEDILRHLVVRKDS
jgi:small subunit ribosomal protein S6